VQSVHTSYKGYVLIEILTNYMYSTKYLHMYPLCISITSPDKGHTSSTPRGQYFSIKLLGHTKDMLASFGDHLASRKKCPFWGVHPPTRRSRQRINRHLRGTNTGTETDVEPHLQASDTNPESEEGGLSITLVSCLQMKIALHLLLGMGGCGNDASLE
jgi:hypothetical protein